MTAFIELIALPEGKGFAADNEENMKYFVEERGATHVRLKTGEVYNLRKVNQKSISLDDASAPASMTSVPFTRINALGTIEEATTGENPPTAPNDPIETAQQTPEHADRAHAVLSASGAARWMACTPSALLEAELPDSTSEAAEQGTAAHELAEHKLRKATKQRSERPLSHWHDDDMEVYTDHYVNYVTNLITDGAELFIEQRLDFSHLVPDGFGTGDAVIIADGTMHLIDLKYGQGILVEAEGNPQLRLYALGALNQFDMLYDIDDVVMHIYQPRRGNIANATMSVADLETWGETIVKPAAALAAAGEGQFVAGEHCTFCKLKNTCRARSEQALEIAQWEFEPTVDLTDDEIAQALKIAPLAKKWIADLEKYATTAAVDHGKTWPGFKVVEGRSIRKWVDEQAVATAAESAGYKDVWNKKLIGITEMQKLMGKQEFTDVLGDLVHKPDGKPTLVPVEDKRPALEQHTAESDFAA